MQIVSGSQATSRRHLFFARVRDQRQYDRLYAKRSLCHRCRRSRLQIQLGRPACGLRLFAYVEHYNILNVDVRLCVGGCSVAASRRVIADICRHRAGRRWRERAQSPPRLTITRPLHMLVWLTRAHAHAHTHGSRRSSTNIHTQHTTLCMHKHPSIVVDVSRAAVIYSTVAHPSMQHAQHAKCMMLCDV